MNELREFVTKDGGERNVTSSGYVREPQGTRPDFSLLTLKNLPYGEQPLTRIAGLLARGAQKYAARNFENADSVEDLARFESSASRHFQQWLSGETDEDHFAAVYFNMMAAEMVKYKLKVSNAKLS
jgi:hypothetical protein